MSVHAISPRARRLSRPSKSSARRDGSKVDRIHEIDDGKMTDKEIAEKVGCHPAYVRSVRQVHKKLMARAHRSGANASRDCAIAEPSSNGEGVPS